MLINNSYEKQKLNTHLSLCFSVVLCEKKIQLPERARTREESNDFESPLGLKRTRECMHMTTCIQHGRKLKDKHKAGRCCSSP